MLILGVVIMFFTLIIILYYKNATQTQDAEEYKQVEDWKRRIDELDVDNVAVDSKKGTAKIIVPDIVDVKESNIISKQKEECKEYEVKPKQKIEKNVIGTNKKDEVFENTEIERAEDKEDDDPIKENNDGLNNNDGEDDPIIHL